MAEDKKITWNCVECNTPLMVKVNSRYYNCGTCGTTYRFRWRGHQIENHFLLNKIKNVMDSAPVKEDLQQNAQDHKQRIHELSEQIRRIEMAKGGERIRLISFLAILAAAIFFLFRITVQGISTFSNPDVIELSVLGVAGLSILILLVFQFRKSAIVRKCNLMIKERDELEQNLDNTEAVLDLHFHEDPEEQEEVAVEVQPETKEEGPEEKAPTSDKSVDIIEKFASKRRSSRRRLSLREEDD